MNKIEWKKKISDFIGEIEKDEDLDDDDFLELMNELSEEANDAHNAKIDEQGGEFDDEDDEEEDDEEDKLK